MQGVIFHRTPVEMSRNAQMQDAFFWGAFGSPSPHQLKLSTSWKLLLVGRHMAKNWVAGIVCSNEIKISLFKFSFHVSVKFEYI